MFGAAAMSLSSFCVVTNALRLNTVKLYPNSTGQKPVSKKSTQKKEIKTMTMNMKIQGMMCEHCEARVKKALEALPEVESALVSHKDGTAVVTLRTPVDASVLKETVEAQDYTVTEVA